GIVISRGWPRLDARRARRFYYPAAKKNNRQPAFPIRVRKETMPTNKSTKPNILIIWGDDIGWFNVSAYHRGIMGYRTPNIDRVGKEGAMFTDWYGQQSCTAG